MPDPCIIKSGEIVLLDDPRLNDTDCSIEPGVIIRPPVDDAITEADPKKKEDAPKKKPITKSQPAQRVEEKTEVPVEIPKPIAVKEKKTESHIEMTQAPPPVEQPIEVTPEAIMMATVAAVAIAGGAAATSAAGGISVIQSKLASLFGSKASVVAAAGVTAGTIVAVKAMESKMSNLEKDMKKAKEDVDGAASSIDRIDELLSRLGGDNDDKLDPSV